MEYNKIMLILSVMCMHIHCNNNNKHASDTNHYLTSLYLAAFMYKFVPYKENGDSSSNSKSNDD